MRNFILSSALCLMAFSAHAQQGYRDSNRIGISGGINQFNLTTDDFDTSAGVGWTAGLSVRGNFYNDFDMVYDIRFTEHRFSAHSVDPLLDDVDTKMQSAQISLYLSYKLIENHLSIEFGPTFQFNGKLDFNEDDQLTPIMPDGTTIKDIEEIKVFNFYPTIGITGGTTHVRAHLFFQYGVTNILRGQKSLSGESLKGNGVIFGGNICFYL